MSKRDAAVVTFLAVLDVALLLVLLSHFHAMAVHP